MEEISIVFLDFTEEKDIRNWWAFFDNLWEPLVNKFSIFPRIEKEFIKAEANTIYFTLMDFPKTHLKYLDRVVFFRRPPFLIGKKEFNYAAMNYLKNNSFYKLPQFYGYRIVAESMDLLYSRTTKANICSIYGYKNFTEMDLCLMDILIPNLRCYNHLLNRNMIPSYSLEI